MSDEPQAHSSSDDDDAPCGVQLGQANAPDDDVIAHSARAAGQAVACGAQLGVTGDDGDDAPCGAQLGQID